MDGLGEGRRQEDAPVIRTRIMPDRPDPRAAPKKLAAQSAASTTSCRTEAQRITAVATRSPASGSLWRSAAVSAVYVIITVESTSKKTWPRLKLSERAACS